MLIYFFVYMNTCLYIWRFQPFHIGHLDVVSQIFEQGYEQIVIWVGSMNQPRSERNPWTFPERKQMIEAGLHDRGVDMDRITIVGIPDFSEDEDRYVYIIETFDFDAVMSGNEWVIGIFEGHKQLVLEEQERIAIHGTDIRALLNEQAYDEVKKWVTPGVYKSIKA